MKPVSLPGFAARPDTRAARMESAACAAACIPRRMPHDACLPRVHRAARVSHSPVTRTAAPPVQ